MIDCQIDTLRKGLDKPLPGRAAQELMAPSLRPAGKFSPDHSEPRPSGVLILVFPGMKGLSTVFIERSQWGPHGGQISLPGGKKEDQDPDIIFTALREAYEEIGIVPSGVETIGLLSTLYVPHSNYLIQPVVGYLTSQPVFMPDLHEVDSIVIVGLSDLFDPMNRKTMVIRRPGTDITAPYYDADGHHVWGATAMIMSELEVILTSGISG
jgi:8-oxo-dGTP pyrophosphatase MutT (NUDIX family)